MNPNVMVSTMPEQLSAKRPQCSLFFIVPAYTHRCNSSIVAVPQGRANSHVRPAPLLERGLTEADEAAVKCMLAETGQQSPGTLPRLAKAIAGANAALLTPWLQDVAREVGVVL